jgi:hypothetical protein
MTADELLRDCTGVGLGPFDRALEPVDRRLAAGTTGEVDPQAGLDNFNASRERSGPQCGRDNPAADLFTAAKHGGTERSRPFRAFVPDAFRNPGLRKATPRAIESVLFRAALENPRLTRVVRLGALHEGDASRAMKIIPSVPFSTDKHCLKRRSGPGETVELNLVRGYNPST